MGKASQRKGRAGELELARILQNHGYDVQPGRARSYGEVPDLSGLHGIHVEAKRCEQLRYPNGWLRQNGTLCVLVTASPPCSTGAAVSRGL